MKHAAQEAKGLYLVSFFVFLLLLLLFSVLAFYYSIRNRITEINSIMRLSADRSDQIYTDIVSNFWQEYLPIIQASNDNSNLLIHYFQDTDSLTPMEKQELSSFLDTIHIVDDRIAWIALFNPARSENYVKFASDTALLPLSADFPYLDRLTRKTKHMEVYGRKPIPAFPDYDTFAIAGGLPQGFGSGNIVIGFHTSAFSFSQNLLKLHETASLSLYLFSQGEMVYDSDEKYDNTLLTPPEAEYGVSDFWGTDKYYLCSPTGNDSSYVICVMDKSAFLRYILKDIPLLLGLYAIFLLLSFIVILHIRKRINYEVSIIRNGLNHIADNQLDYRLPTSFSQDGFTEIARDINTMSSKLDESIKKAYYFELKQKDAEMAELQATFHPHFLYNTLEMLRSKSYSNGDLETASLIANLSSIFRSFVGAKTFISIREELTFSRKYLSLLTARYGDAVSCNYDIDSDILQYGIIRNVFQLLIENYFVHGFEADKPDNQISFIAHARNEDDILIEVRDNGQGMTSASIEELNRKIEEPIRHNSENFGLKNLNQRLKLFYGPSYRLHIEPNAESGIAVIIRIRKITVEEYEKRLSQ